MITLSKKNINLRLLLLLTLALVLVIAGCGNSNDNGNANVENNDANEENQSKETEETVFPENSIEVIVNYGAGGATDTAARIVIDKANDFLPNNQRFVIVNKPGGGGTIGPRIVAEAEPDGYTIGTQAGSPMAIAPFLNDTGYKPEDFQPILQQYQVSQALLVHKNSPIQTFEEWMTYVKDNPGKFRFMADAKFGTARLAVEGLKLETGIETTILVGDGAADSKAALLGEHVDGIIANVSGVDGEIKDGTFRALVYITDNKVDFLPEDLPTLEDFGATNVSFFNGFIAPKGVPEERFDIIHNAIRKAYDDPGVREKLTNSGYLISGNGPEEFQKVISDTVEFNKKILKEIGVETID